MKLFKYIVAIVLALTAVFSGGCGAFFLYVVVNETSLFGEGDHGMTFMALAYGIVPSIVCGLLAWWAFKSAKGMA